MVGWHHQLNGHEFEQAPRDGEGQGSLECAAVYQVAKSQTLLSYWRATTIYMETPTSWLFSRDFIGQKGVALENQTNKRKKPTSKRLRETSCNPWLWIGSISVNVWGVLMCVCVCVYTFPSSVHLRDLETMTNSTVSNYSCTQIMVLKYNVSPRETRTSGVKWFISCLRQKNV